MKMMSKKWIIAVCLVCAGLSAGCNTIGGLGKDIQSGAEATRNALTTQPTK